MRLGIPLLIGLGVLAIVWLVVRNEAPSAPIPIQPTEETYTNAEFGLSFAYPSNYVRTERDEPGTAERRRHTITLVRRDDLPPPEAGEGPPALTVQLFQNDLDTLSTESWVRGSNDSNFKLSPNQELTPITVSGKPAVAYRWDGLYTGRTVAYADERWIYAFSVTYLDPSDTIVSDFDRLLSSVVITH